MNFKTVIAIICSAGVATGCASTGRVKDLETEVQSTKLVAEQALNIAHDAHRVAHEADTRSKNTEEKMNRLFKKSQYK